MNAAQLASPKEVVDRIFAVFAEKGHRHYGESVTELQHALQCAEFARQFGESDDLIAACLLHDYGHLRHDLGETVADQGIDALHEELGANELAAWFPPHVVEPVRMHVVAKRYLCWKNKAYLDGLSPASRQSLMLQGGPMNDAEAAEFEQRPYFELAVQLRKYDDMGKMKDMSTPDLEHFRPILERLVIAG